MRRIVGTVVLALVVTGVSPPVALAASIQAWVVGAPASFGDRVRVSAGEACRDLRGRVEGHQ